MVGGMLREVAVRGRHRLVCDGWKYYDQLRGNRRVRGIVGYFETDEQAIQAWLDMLGVAR